MKTHFFGSDGLSLVFTDETMLEKYKEDKILLDLKYYVLIRNKFGIYASNQDKFVQRVEDLIGWDSTIMELMLKQHRNKFEDIKDRGFL